MNKGEKVAIVGPNGVGKTTLCRMLVGELPPDAGTIEWGHEVSVGYIAQDHGDGIPEDTTVAEWLHSFDDAPTCRTSAGSSARCSSRARRG